MGYERERDIKIDEGGRERTQYKDRGRGGREIKRYKDIGSGGMRESDKKIE